MRPLLRLERVIDLTEPALDCNTVLTGKDLQYLRLRSRRGPKKAIVAVAASIFTAAYHMLKDGTLPGLGRKPLRPARQRQARSAPGQPFAGPWIRRPDHPCGGLI